MFYLDFSVLFFRMWSRLFFLTADVAFSFQVFVLHFYFQPFTLYRNDRRLCFIWIFLLFVHFLHVSRLFFPTADIAFSFQLCSCYISLFDCSHRSLHFECRVPNCPVSAFLFTPVGEMDLILSIPGVSGPQLHTTPLPVCLLTATMWKVPIT